MIADILNVAEKELREILTFGDSRGRSKISLVVLLLIFGVVLPLQSTDWFSSMDTFMLWGWMPFLWVSGVVADLFAGERERHTLEALLATRLSDQAILFGKLLAALCYGFLLTWVIMFVSAITVNIANLDQGLAFYPGELLLLAFIFSLIISGLSASIGVLVSLRAGSVRQAQQLMSVGMLVLLLPLMLVRFVPQSWLMAIEQLLESGNLFVLFIWIAVGLLIVEMILIAIARRLFKRSRLILD